MHERIMKRDATALIEQPVMQISDKLASAAAAVCKHSGLEHEPYCRTDMLTAA